MKLNKDVSDHGFTGSIARSLSIAVNSVFSIRFFLMYKLVHIICLLAVNIISESLSIVVVAARKGQAS